MREKTSLKTLNWVWVLAMGCSDGDQLPPTDGPPVQATIRLETVASGLQNPLHLTAPAGDARLFVVEQPGRIRIVENGQLLATPFADLSAKLRSGGEQGLLSLAFDPRYATNGFFYVNYTDLQGHTRVERYRVSASDRYRADPASAKLILMINQPFSNHNGGHILFGPDGMLYIAMGDGGSGGDPQGHGQDRSTLLGDLLRIDVSQGDPYSIPADNPFVGQSSVRGEIWASGLRNPWRIAFDRTANILFIADVGQNTLEEVNAVPVTQKGLNFGWNRMEGDRCYPSGDSCNRTGLTLPVLTYGRADGCSVTGGLVYRGSRIPALRGHYFYSDYCQGWVRSFRLENGVAVDKTSWNLGSIGSVLSYGEDASGELYILTSGGRVHRIIPG